MIFYHPLKNRFTELKRFSKNQENFHSLTSGILDFHIRIGYRFAVEFFPRFEKGDFLGVYGPSGLVRRPLINYCWSITSQCRANLS